MDSRNLHCRTSSSYSTSVTASERKVRALRERSPMMILCTNLSLIMRMRALIDLPRTVAPFAFYRRMRGMTTSASSGWHVWQSTLVHPSCASTPTSFLSFPISLRGDGIFCFRGYAFPPNSLRFAGIVIATFSLLSECCCAHYSCIESCPRHYVLVHDNYTHGCFATIY